MPYAPRLVVRVARERETANGLLHLVAHFALKCTHYAAYSVKSAAHLAIGVQFAFSQVPFGPAQAWDHVPCYGHPRAHRRHRAAAQENGGVAMTERRGYIFEDRASEDERLLSQGKILDPLTRRVLRKAGLAPGMRVLDLGSGAGNVAMVAAELVGPEGRVVGVERDPDAVERARRLISETGRANIEFRVGDAQTLDGVDSGFDAVTGRLIFLYLADPVAALREAAVRVRPGGLICMHEADFTYPYASPPTPLWQQVRAWFLETLTKAGANPSMGPSLFPAYRAAGLPDPQLIFEAFVAGGPQAPTWGWANVIRGVVPVMERLGIATESEVAPATLADRLLAELLANDGIMIVPMIGAWSTVPPSSK
jgi:SAM-dependent methyltransferase